MSLLIKGGRVIDPATNTDEIMDILLEGEKIKKIAKEINFSADQVLEVSGKIVSPGLIDMHTHLREPGREDEETIQSGTYAAIRGGFTTICCMPNTNPPIDDPLVAKFIYERGKRKGVIEVLPIGAISKRREGKELSEMGKMWKAGVVAFSDDGNWVQNTHLMRRALEYAKMFNLPLISHCEDKTLTQDGVMNEGYFSTILGLRGMPKEAEEIAIFRDITLSKMTGSPLHIAHLSCAGSVRLVKEAKEKGIKVSAEVTPHHFTLTEKEVTSFDTNTKINPPLRREEDLRVLKQGLRDGTIEVIATDHAPHSPEEKSRDYVKAPFGIIGLETALSLVIRELVEKNILSLTQALAKLTINPARILKIDRGRIKEGTKANLVIFDLNKSWVVRKENFLSRSSNSPFIGWRLPGVVEYTIFEGKIVYRNPNSCRKQHK
ncbi:dihydroorotase [Candidatus Aerophobetes bacterium]|nr:dihydroorotase [Candidatus Aerophobetes bacterium]